MEVRSDLSAAWRVLTTISEYRHPDPADLEELKKHAREHEASLPPDELACTIVNREICSRSSRDQT